MKATFILFLSAILFSATADCQNEKLIASTKIISVKTTESKDQKPIPQKEIRNHFAVRSLIIPAVFIGYGFTSLGDNAFRQLNKTISNEVQEDMPGFKTRVDDYL